MANGLRDKFDQSAGRSSGHSCLQVGIVFTSGCKNTASFLKCEYFFLESPILLYILLHSLPHASKVHMAQTPSGKQLPCKSHLHGRFPHSGHPWIAKSTSASNSIPTMAFAKHDHPNVHQRSSFAATSPQNL